MQNTVYYPKSNISRLVSKYAVIQTTPGKEEIITEKSFSNGLCALIFNFGKAVVGYENQEITLPEVFVALTVLKYVNLILYPPIDGIIVMCNPSYFSRIFGLDFSKNSFAPFVDFSGYFPSKNIEKIKKEKNPVKRIELIEQELLLKIENQIAKTDKIDLLCDKLLASKGKGNISDLLKELGLNERTVRRNFPKRVGVSPKAFARVIRFNYLWHLVTEQHPDFMNLIFECEYFDQAHFIHDFKYITGESPKEFFGKNSEIVKILSLFEEKSG